LRIDQRGTCMIRYNLALLDRHGEAFLRDTVPHETAHYVAYRLHGRGIRPHGAEWRNIMQLFGADPSRCHDYDVAGLSARRLRTYTYHCNCGPHQLSSIRHNRIIRGQRYLCRRCGEALRPGRSSAAEPASAG
jgi:SprT protein